MKPRQLIYMIAAGAFSGSILASPPAVLSLRSSGLSQDSASSPDSAIAADQAALPAPSGDSGPPTNYLFGDGFDPPPAFAADQRFSVMWIGGDGLPHRAAIRGDASIRDSDDPDLSVAHVGVGHYCLVMPGGVFEGAVGVLQDQGATHGTIDVTMGIGNPCPQEPDAAVNVQTWQLP